MPIKYVRQSAEVKKSHEERVSTNEDSPLPLCKRQLHMRYHAPSLRSCRKETTREKEKTKKRGKRPLKPNYSIHLSHLPLCFPARKTKGLLSSITTNRIQSIESWFSWKGYSVRPTSRDTNRIDNLNHSFIPSMHHWKCKIAIMIFDARPCKSRYRIVSHVPLQRTSLMRTKENMPRLSGVKENRDWAECWVCAWRYVWHASNSEEVNSSRRQKQSVGIKSRDS